MLQTINAAQWIIISTTINAAIIIWAVISCARNINKKIEHYHNYTREHIHKVGMIHSNQHYEILDHVKPKIKQPRTRDAHGQFQSNKETAA